MCLARTESLSSNCVGAFVVLKLIAETLYFHLHVLSWRWVVNLAWLSNAMQVSIK